MLLGAGALLPNLNNMPLSRMRKMLLEVALLAYVDPIYVQQREV